MSTEVAIPDDVTTDIESIAHLDTPEKRFRHLSRTFTSAMVVIAEMQKNRDWEKLKRDDGTEYKSLTDMVQDALGISDSYARRLVQTSTMFYTPLEAVTVEGTVINITAGEAAKLGNDGMSEVVSKVEEAIEGEGSGDPEVQSALIDNIKDDVLKGKTSPKPLSIQDDFDDFDDDDFEDILTDDDDFDDDDFDFSPPSASSKKSSKKDDSDDFADMDDNDHPPAPQVKDSKKKDEKKQTPSDYLGPIEKIMSGGREYKEDSDIETLPEELQEFVRAVNYLANLDSVALSEMITEERRGVTYSIRKAASNLTLVVSATETSSWVLEQI